MRKLTLVVFVAVFCFLSFAFGIGITLAEENLKEDKQKLEQSIKEQTEKLKKIEKIEIEKAKEERRQVLEKNLRDHFHLPKLTLCEPTTGYRGMVESFGICLDGKHLGDVHSIPTREFTNPKLFQKVLEVLQKNNVSFYVNMPTIDRPLFIQEQIKWFTENYGRREAAWARMFGWGEGLYSMGSGRQTPFYWVMWCNTDGATQMVIDIPLFPIDLRWIRDIKNNSGSVRRWDAEVAESDPVTWIGVGNDWIAEKPYCRLENDRWQCDNKMVLDEIVGSLKKLPFITEMKVTEYIK